MHCDATDADGHFIGMTASMDVGAGVEESGWRGGKTSRMMTGSAGPRSEDGRSLEREGSLEKGRVEFRFASSN